MSLKNTSINTLPVETTLDGILGKRLFLTQPKYGFRIAVDTLLLAASVNAKAGERILDLGCGVGGAMLCLAARVADIQIEGIEIQKDLVEFANINIERNGFGRSMLAREGDVCNLDESYKNFQHVIINPPFHEERSHDVSSNTTKRLANTECNDDLVLWLDAAAKALQLGGTLTLIHRADRCTEILSKLENNFGSVRVLPVITRVDKSPKRVIIQAQKNNQTNVVSCQSFVLHQEDGRYTEEAENILRHAKALSFISQ